MIFGLVGKNINYSYSKKIHEIISNDILYNIMSVDNEQDFLSLLKTGNYGYNITIPYKEIAYKSCDKLSRQAKETKVVNTIVKRNESLYGYNTDVDGFSYLLRKNKIDIEGKNCLVLGTGATSKTVEYVLKKHKARSIYFFSRNPYGEKQFSYSESRLLNEADIIINTTPIGSVNILKQSDIDFLFLKKGSVFIDAIYNPYKTENIIKAKKRDIRYFNGLDMLIYQALKSNELFLNKIYKKDIKSLLSIKSNLMNIAFIGQPCSGKSTIGRSLAKELNMEFVDVDDSIKESFKNDSIKEIFSLYGETRFRNEEDKIIRQVIKETGKVISIGSGIVENKECMDLIDRSCLIVYLKRDLSHLNNIDFIDRPLLNDISDYNKLYKIRKPYYNLYKDIIIFNNATIEKVVERIVKKL